MAKPQFDAALVLFVALSLVGCPNSHVEEAPDTGAMDSGSGRDGGAGDATTTADTAVRDTGAPDAGTDAGSDPDVGTPTDAGPGVDGGPIVGCNPASGIECDGDWTGQCTPACSATQCCSPQHGAFACVARNADGTCPLADLFIDGERITGTTAPRYRVEFQTFAPGACEIMEGCVDGPGTRRLLRWDTWTPNQGGADMFLGTTPPRGTTEGPFVWSECHMHHHFSSYANYELLSSDGAVAATGHKQAFCLEDYYQWPCGGTGQPRCGNAGAAYDCGYQGIQMDYQDVYASNLPCQWIDVTDLPSGDYDLHISLNTEHILAESNYDNNELLVSVTIPDPPPDTDVTTACARTTTGTTRDCGWTRSTAPGLGTCTPGASVTVGCSAGCGLGTCTGDTVMRVCDGSHDPTCTSRWTIASNDDSGCPGSGRCSGAGDCCSQVTFTCPISGTYAAFWAPFSSTGTATCNLAAM